MVLLGFFNSTLKGLSPLLKLSNEYLQMLEISIPGCLHSYLFLVHANDSVPSIIGGSCSLRPTSMGTGHISCLGALSVRGLLSLASCGLVGLWELRLRVLEGLREAAVYRFSGVKALATGNGLHSS